MKYKSIFCTYIYILTALAASAQTDSTFIPHAISKLNQQPAAEKVYLHLNKQGYTFGDTIWYKAYTVIGQHHQLSALSGVLYVEFYSPKDSLVIRQILQLHSGVSWGDIPLPHNLKQGSYRIRAYTNWMRNFGEGQFFNKHIRIGGIPPGTSNPGVANPDVQFFPEGGALIEGIRSRIAFKAVSPSGLGQDITGTVTDNAGNTVAEFTSQHLGMGTFVFTPENGKTYSAKITTAGGSTFTTTLPKAHEAGYTLALNNRLPDSIYFKVAVNDKQLANQKNTAFYVIAQSNGKVYYTTQGKLQQPQYTAQVDKKRFPTGIVQFTLFSQSGEPLAERLAYVEGADTLKLHIGTNKTAYALGENVKIYLQAVNNSDQPTTGSFSVAVINDSKAAEDEQAENTIMNDLLLTSNLKGNIEQPNYYFINKTDQTRADLDLLLLTQGYRSFEWKQVLNDTTPKIIYQPQQALELNGILKTKSGKPVPNGKVTLVSVKENILMDTTTDGGGNFKFSGLNLLDTQKIVLRARSKSKDDDVNIFVKNTEYAKITTDNQTNDSTAFSPEMASTMQQNYSDYRQKEKQEALKNAHILKEVVIRDYRPKKPELVHSDNLNGPGNADQVIMGKDLYNCINLSDCLVSKIFGVTFKNGIPYNIRLAKFTPTPMTIIIDGVVTTAVSGQMDNLSASDVYSIEVLRSGAYLAIYGSEAPGGALVITTKRGGEDGYDMAVSDPKGIITYPFTGYAKTKVFYSPKYTLKPISETEERSTIYWNPNILTGADGKTSFEYFNAGKGTYRIIIEGIDDNGDLGRQVYRYKVE